MLLIDICVRFPNITISAILILLFLRHARQYFQAWLAVGLLLASIASSLHTMPLELGLPRWVFSIALFVSVPASALQWWLARSVLQDDFRPGAFDWTIMSAACLFKLGWSLQGIGIMPPAHSFRFVGSYALAMWMTIQIVWIALSELRNDLVEPRRRARYWFVIFLAMTAGTNLSAELLGLSKNLETIIIHATTLPLLLAVLFWLTTLSPEKLFFHENRPNSARPDDIPDRMEPAFKRLVHFVENDHGYTDQTLTVGSLADAVGLPEHQLRKLINNALGYRNFADYLNSYRLAHAKAALSDPDQAQIPILTIAMDAGYKTLSTFNRAFKAAENETPSEFRRRAWRAASKGPDKQVQI